MSDRNRSLKTPIAVISVCVLLFLAAVALAVFGPQESTNPAVGFPIILVILAVVTVIGTLVWRSVSRRKSDEHR